MAGQRLEVTGRDVSVVAVVALLAGVGAAIAGPSPTGAAAVDAVLVTVLAAAVVWAGAAAPWWALAAASVVAVVLAPSWPWLLVALAAAAGAAYIGRRRAAVPWARALVLAALVQVFVRLGEVWRFGVSATVAIVVLAAVALAGVLRRPGRERRRVWFALAAVPVAAALASLGLGVAAADARPELERAVDKARLGIDQLRAGRFVEAAGSFRSASAAFDQADSALGRPWGQPARLVPVVAQHRALGTSLSAEAASITDEIAGVLDGIDIENLKVAGGRIDLDAVAALQAPLESLRGSLDELDAAIEATDSPWLVAPAQRELGELAGEIQQQRTSSDRAIEAVRQAPAMLGADGPRRYFMAFMTPVEARGLGGLMGNWAEVTIDEGRIQVSDFARHTDLNDRAAGPQRITGPADFLDAWGDYGFRDADGLTRWSIWGDVTYSPHFPNVAEVITQLYPQSGGDEVDGVFVMDVYALAALMQLTGEIELPDADLTITPEYAAQFLIRDQYVAYPDFYDRFDALGVIANTVIDRLLSDDLPTPPELADLMSPFVRQGRMAGWSSHADEQALFELIGMDGGLPDPAGHDAVAVVFNNAGNNKMDMFLTGSSTYDLRPRPADGVVEATLTLELHNEAPTSGLPDHVNGYELVVGAGVNEMLVTVYSQIPVSGVTVDGEPVGIRPSGEAGYLSASFFVTMEAGESAEVVVAMAGSVDDPAEYVRQVTWRSPPTVTSMPATITVDGRPLGEPTTDAGVYVLR